MNKSKIISKQIPICLSCYSIPLFLSLTYTSKFDIIFKYKCKCNSKQKEVLLSQYFENIFLLTKIIEINCNCGKRYQYYCSTCDIYVCDTCLKVHNNHILFSAKTKLHSKKCKKHQKNKDFYCKKCNIEICEDCSKNIHHSHNTLSFFMFYQETKRKSANFIYNSDTFNKDIVNHFPEEKKDKAYNEIKTLLSYYKNAFEHISQIKSFDVLISMSNINKLNIKSEIKYRFRYNSFPHLFLSNKPLHITRKEIKYVFFTKKENIVLITENKIEVYSQTQNLLKSKPAIADSRYFLFPNKEIFAAVTCSKVFIYDIETLELKKEISFESEEYDKFLIVNNTTICFPFAKENCVVIDIITNKQTEFKISKMNGYCINRLNNGVFVFIYKDNFEVWDLLNGKCEKKVKFGEEKNELYYKYKSYLISKKMIVVTIQHYHEFYCLYKGYSTKDYSLVYSVKTTLNVYRMRQIDEDNAILISNNEYQIFDIETGNVLSIYKKKGMNSYYEEDEDFEDEYDKEDDFCNMSSKKKRFFVINKIFNLEKYRAFLNYEC